MSRGPWRDATGGRASGGRRGRRAQSRFSSGARGREQCRAFLVSPIRACRGRGRGRRVSDFPTAGIRRNRGCAGRRASRRPDHVRLCERAGREDREWIPETIGASYAPRRSALLARLPGSNPFADARVRDTFASVKGGERARDAGDLPLVGVEVGGNRFGGEEGSAAAGAFGELFKAALGRATYAN